jgi:hypothetical protein
VNRKRKITLQIYGNGGMDMFPMDFIDFSKATKDQLYVIVYHDQVEMAYKRLAWQRLKKIIESEKEVIRTKLGNIG